MEILKKGDKVLVIWKNSIQDDLRELVEEITKCCGNDSVVLENSEMITAASRPQSSFDVIISNWLTPHSVNHTDDLLHILLTLLKPCGKVVINDDSDLTSMLKLNGFVNVSKNQSVYSAEKPNFEVGSKAPLKLGNKPAIWKIDDTIESAWNNAAADDELINDDELLDEEDLKKPDQESLRVCATTGKRKACADCSCGLAEELAGKTKDTPKSSCGSCYLGDAFRCATCPYLGMPAFKPGEKVVLDLKSDI